MRWFQALFLMTLAAAAGCNKGTPTDPTPVTNTPPVIQSLVSNAVQVEADGEIQLTAVVTDAETSLSQLTYTWSAAPSGGTIIGTGASVRWRAPKPATTPDLYTLRLTVTERYVSSGSERTNEVSATLQVRYNDSVAELMNITGLFLNEFMNDNVTPDMCVRNFSDTQCASGKAMERQDVQNNRTLFNSISAQFNFVRVDVTPRSSAYIEAPCTFRSTRKSDGALQVASGTCVVTAVYDTVNFRWWLCTSNFLQSEAGESNSLTRLLSRRR